MKRRDFLKNALIAAGGAVLASTDSSCSRASNPEGQLRDAQKKLHPGHGTAHLSQTALASRYYGNDAPWYLANIPFFECSDPKIQDIYYYRWKLYKSHLKDLGERGYIVTEFLSDVSWSLKPYESLNDATAFHIHEGRWLKDQRYVGNYIDFMYHGGNDRHFSEAIADAAYANYLATGDRAFAIKNLNSMKEIYAQWDDHYDSSKELYYIQPIYDATEYTIASIDASGGKDGFFGGQAFRPTINSYMYANALAISKLSAMAGDQASAKEYASKASALQKLLQTDLWNPGFQHFVDRYEITNQYVHYWDFIRGRELAGYTPWYFELPDQIPEYVASWQHIIDSQELAGAYGIRTVEPSYQYYMTQYAYDMDGGVRKPECQWNGPAWPFQTTYALGGLANLLNDYPKQNVISADDYVRMLRQYTQLHYLNGEPDIQEDYNPDTGAVIVGHDRSHHYNHSNYTDLIITGLAGLRPRADDVLEVNPLIPTSEKAVNPITYLLVENIPYHGRMVTVHYDRDGERYGKGAGLSVYVDGKLVVHPTPLGRKTVMLSASPSHYKPPAPALADMAVNMTQTGFPAPDASVNNDAADVYQAIDGRVWFYPNVRNYWTNQGSPNKSDWYSLDFGETKPVHTAHLYFYGDGEHFQAPSSAIIQYWNGQDWTEAAVVKTSTAHPVENGETILTFSPVETSRLRAVFTNPQNAAVALVEMKVYGTQHVVTNEPLGSELNKPGLPVALVNLHSQNSKTGIFNGMRWRDAEKGGYFSFDLKLVPKVANDLIVTYWGSDVSLGTSARTFDILVDGDKVGEQTLQNNQPGKFFDATYSIPIDLTKDKSSATVRFQASAGDIAGGVFGARFAQHKP